MILLIFQNPYEFFYFILKIMKKFKCIQNDSRIHLIKKIFRLYIYWTIFAQCVNNLFELLLCKIKVLNI